DIEGDRTRLTRVQVPRIFARPAKGFSVHPLHTCAVDLSRFPKIELGLRKIAADDSDQLDRRKITRGCGRVRCRTAQQIAMFFHRRFDGVERNGTHNEQRLQTSGLNRALHARAYFAMSDALSSAGTMPTRRE